MGMMGKPQRNWTTKEIDYLIDNYSKKRNKELANDLNRSLICVGTYANKILKLRKKS